MGVFGLDEQGEGISVDLTRGCLPGGRVEVDNVEVGGWVDGGFAVVFCEEEGGAEVAWVWEGKDVGETCICGVQEVCRRGVDCDLGDVGLWVVRCSIDMRVPELLGCQLLRCFAKVPGVGLGLRLSHDLDDLLCGFFVVPKRIHLFYLHIFALRDCE